MSSAKSLRLVFRAVLIAVLTLATVPAVTAPTAATTPALATSPSCPTLGTNAFYGVDDEGRLRYVELSTTAPFGVVKELVSAQGLPFRPTAIAVVDANTIMVTSPASDHKIYRVDVTRSDTALEFQGPVDIGFVGWSHQDLAYNGISKTYGIASGQLIRYSLSEKNEVVKASFGSGAIYNGNYAGFTLSSLTAVGANYVYGMSSDGKLQGYSIGSDMSWSAAGIWSASKTPASMASARELASSASGLLFWLDSSNSLHSINPQSTSGITVSTIDGANWGAYRNLAGVVAPCTNPIAAPAAVVMPALASTVTCPATTHAFYGIDDQGRLRYSELSTTAPFAVVKEIISARSLPFQPVAMAVVDANTILVTSPAADHKLFRLDVTNTGTVLEFQGPVDLGFPGWSHSLLAYNGGTTGQNFIFGISAGQLIRYPIYSANEVAKDLIGAGSIYSGTYAGFTLSTLTVEGANNVFGMDSTGKLQGYSIGSDMSWSPARLSDGTTWNPSNTPSAMVSARALTSTADGQMFWLDQRGTLQSFDPTHPGTSVATTSGADWDQYLLLGGLVAQCSDPLPAAVAVPVPVPASVPACPPAKGGAAFYGIDDAGRLRYVELRDDFGGLHGDGEPYAVVKELVSARSLGFMPKALTVVDANTILVTSPASDYRLLRIDVTRDDTELDFQGPVDIGYPGWSHDFLAYNGAGTGQKYIFGVSSGQLIRYPLSTTNEVVKDSIGAGAIYGGNYAGFTLSTLTVEGDNNVFGLDSSGQLQGYSIGSDMSWSPAKLSDGTTWDPSNTPSSMARARLVTASARGTMFWLDASDALGSFEPTDADGEVGTIGGASWDEYALLGAIVTRCTNPMAAPTATEEKYLADVPFPEPRVKDDTPTSFPAQAGLSAGSVIRSPNGRYNVRMTRDGDFALYESDSAEAWLWQTGTGGSGYDHFSFDGRTGVTMTGTPAWGEPVSPWHQTAWSSEMHDLSLTDPDYASKLTFDLRDDGSLDLMYGTQVIGDFGDLPFLTSKPPSRVAAPGILWAGESLQSPNRDYTLRLEVSGNLVLYKGEPIDDHEVWRVAGDAGLANRLEVIDDGDAFIYLPDTRDGWLWHAGVSGVLTMPGVNSESSLELRDDGSVVFRNVYGGVYATMGSLPGVQWYDPWAGGGPGSLLGVAPEAWNCNRQANAGNSDDCATFSDFSRFDRTWFQSSCGDPEWDGVKWVDTYVNCTNYVAYRLDQLGLASFMGACNYSTSNASSWDERATCAAENGDHPFVLDGQPAAGAVLQFNDGAPNLLSNGTMGSDGHVAYIDAIFGDTVYISEAFCHKHATRRIAMPLEDLLAKIVSSGGTIRVIHP